jgi:hypothetical protein
VPLAQPLRFPSLGFAALAKAFSPAAFAYAMPKNGTHSPCAAMTTAAKAHHALRSGRNAVLFTFRNVRNTFATSETRIRDGKNDFTDVAGHSSMPAGRLCTPECTPDPRCPSPDAPAKPAKPLLIPGRNGQPGLMFRARHVAFGGFLWNETRPFQSVDKWKYPRARQQPDSRPLEVSP